MNRQQYLTLLLLLAIGLNARAQKGEWPALPGLDYSESSIALIDQESFMALAGAATASFILAEWVLKDVADINYYQARAGMVGTSGGTVMLENFGIEKRLAHWFGIGLELNTQQWFYEEKAGAGIGFNTYYRWYLRGRKRLSPYIEYGAGLFRGFSEFPPDGTRFTFNLTTQLGLEYQLNNQDKVRLGYGHLHQSNNGLLEPNPGEDGNGFNVTYLWLWK